MSTPQPGEEEHVPWNSKLENAVRTIRDDTKSYMKMHMYQAQRSNIIYNRLIVAGIVMGPLGGIFSAINQVSGIGPSPGLSIAEIILGFMSGVIVAIIKFGKYDEASNSNQKTAAMYTSLSANANRQLSLDRADRIHAIKYLDWLQTKYDEIILSAPLLSPQIHTKFIDIKPVKPYDNVISISVDQRTPSPQINRSNTMTKTPEINKYSDKMLQYEMQRMFDNK